MLRFRPRKPRTAQRVKSDHPGRHSFVAFCEKLGPLLTANFVITPQLVLFAFLVEPAIVRSEGWLRLILVWPPGTGKTWTGILFLAWCFGLHPDWHELALCLSAELASDIGGDVKSLIESPEFAEIFPSVGMAKDSKSRRHFEVVDRGATGRGEFNAAGRSTRFTGRRGKIIYQDDLINEKEADSPVALKDAYSTIKASYSRGHPAGYHWLINNTRYREDDPIGHILDKYAGEGPWVVVVLPTIVEKGEAQVLTNGWERPEGDVLYPYTTERILKAKESYFKLGLQHEWYGQHKGMPRPPTGRKVDRSWFKRYSESPGELRKRCDRVVMSVDTAVKDKQSNDPTAITVWGEHGDRKYLLEVIVERLLYDALLVRLAKCALEWKPSLCLMESAGSGAQAADFLRKQRSVIDVAAGRIELPWRTDIVEIKPVGNKWLRFYASIPTMRQGEVWIPESAPWIEEWLTEITDAPRVIHDDQCDSTAMFINWATENAPSPYSSNEVPADIARGLTPSAVRGRSSRRDDGWSPMPGMR